MARVDMHARHEYLKVVRESYVQARSRAEKSLILDRYCGDTGLSRKYVIRRMHAADPRSRAQEEEEGDL